MNEFLTFLLSPLATNSQSFNKSVLYQIFWTQEVGITVPLLVQWTLLQELRVLSPSSRTKSISCNFIPRHGTVLLQLNLTDTFEALVPLMFLYSTCLIATALRWNEGRLLISCKLCCENVMKRVILLFLPVQGMEPWSRSKIDRWL